MPLKTAPLQHSKIPGGLNGHVTACPFTQGTPNVQRTPADMQKFSRSGMYCIVECRSGLRAHATARTPSDPEYLTQVRPSDSSSEALCQAGVFGFCPALSHWDGPVVGGFVFPIRGTPPNERLGRLMYVVASGKFLCMYSRCVLFDWRECGLLGCPEAWGPDAR